MKHFFLLLILFLVACEPATTAPALEPAPEVEEPMVSEPMPEQETDEVEEPVTEEPEVEEPEPSIEEPEVTEPEVTEPEETESETSTEETTQTDDESTSEDSDTTEDESEESTVFTAATLAYYDGQEGRPAYVAVNGVVYDVTSSPRWRNGAHNGFQAGRDLTSQFNAQHGDTRLSRFPVVGTYQD